jgi:hypothetical protein
VNHLETDRLVRAAFRPYMRDGTLYSAAHTIIRRYPSPGTPLRIAAHAILGKGPVWERMQRAAACIRAGTAR